MSKTKVIYSAMDYDNDVKSFEETENGKHRLDLSAFRRLMVHDLCTNTTVLRDYKIGHYALEKVQDAISNPALYSNLIIGVNRFLINKSQFYNRLCYYFSKMGLLNY